MSLVRNRNTRSEVLVRSILHHLGFRFRLHPKDLPGTPDIVLPKFHTVIFVNGCFWHGHNCPRGHLPQKNHAFWAEKIGRNIARDQMNRDLLEQAGWFVITVWTCELSSSKKVESFASTIEHRVQCSSQAKRSLSRCDDSDCSHSTRRRDMKLKNISRACS